jgi:RNA polymerase sigma factor (sigma-70 family)
VVGAQAMTHDTVDRNQRFRAFVADHRDRAVSMAWRLCGGNQALAEDIAQEAFAQAWRGLAGFRDEAKLSTWFYRILIRQANAQRRKYVWRNRYNELTGQEPARVEAQPDDGLKRRIAQALEGISAGQREAFVLVHMEGFTVVEAAAMVGRAPGTLKSHLHRALKALRIELADIWEGER